MIVFSGLRWKILAATAPSCCDLADVCREAVEHCNILRAGIDLSFRRDIIEARPGSDPAQLADIFERRAAKAGGWMPLIHARRRHLAPLDQLQTREDRP